ncbi:hypothetical protein [Tardiphaga sp. 803_E3_N1_3]|uniref:hypothetical protein n=1 Tax=unclassified Tardiphaga TaxID=2631404 RepID=UPI003F2760A0
MFEHITPDTLAAEAFFLRAASATGTIALVEGDSDFRLLQNLLEIDISNFVNCYGKTNALQTNHALNTSNFEGHICFVDADFSRLGSAPPSLANVVVSEFHDLEVTLFRSDALLRLLSEDGSREKIKALTDSGKTVLNILYSACLPIGALRLYGIRNMTALKFKGIGYKCISKKLVLNVKSLVKEVYDNSQIFTGREEAESHLHEFEFGNFADDQLVCGHDLSGALSIGLRSHLGSRPSALCASEELESKLRIAFGYEDFKQTGMYADILSWESDNAPFRCLA